MPDASCDFLSTGLSPYTSMALLHIRQSQKLCEAALMCLQELQNATLQCIALQPSLSCSYH